MSRVETSCIQRKYVDERNEGYNWRKVRFPYGSYDQPDPIMFQREGIMIHNWAMGKKCIVLAAVFWMLAAQGVFAQVKFTVTDTIDSGPGSLRQAILDANASTGKDTIAFDIPGLGPHTIQPTSALPTITDSVIIDGTTEPDFAGTPIIELDGSNAGYVNGLRITAGNSTVQGLVINQFAYYGILIETNGSNVIECNYIGTDVTGTVALGNSESGVMIYNGPDSNTIGGTTAGASNVISGNSGNGVGVHSGTGNAILGNAISSNALLGIDLGNDGVTPNDPGDADTGANNLQNFPDITSVKIDGNGDLLIEYNVDSDTTHSAYPLTIQFFGSDNSGEGETLLGNDTYTITDFITGGKTVNLGNVGIIIGDSIVAITTDSSGNTSEFSVIFFVSIEDCVVDKIPTKFNLYQNYPNPYTSSTTIRYHLPKETKVSLKIYNQAGQLVRTLVNGTKKAGAYTVRWDGKDKHESDLPNGVYFYRLETGDFTSTKKMVLIR